jgi:hypothetical protein
VTIEAGLPEQRLRLEITFHGIDESQAQAIAAQMIDRAHEIANLPEFECDVDVSVERTSAVRGIEAGEQQAGVQAVTR